MADQIEIVDGAASFAYNAQGGQPWHRMGVALPSHATVDEILAAARADYEVDLRPVYVLDDEGNPVPVPDRYATSRISPKTGQREAFEVVKSRYTVLQNRELVERALTIVGAAEGEAVLETAGVLYEGRRFFASIDLGTLVIDPVGVNDEIKRYLSLYTSHDTTFPTTIANTPIRPVCENTVQAGFRQARSVFKVKHFANQDQALAEARKVLGFSLEWAENFKAMADQMLATPMTPGRFDQVIDVLSPASEADTDRKKANRDALVDTLRAIYSGPRNAGRVGNNGWAAYNTVVEYLDHHRERVDPYARAAQALDAESLITRQKMAVAERVLSLN